MPIVSAFAPIKNEAQFIGYGAMSMLPHVGEIVYFDGNSTDGTLEILEYIQKTYDKEGKIKVFKDKDFKDFREDYVRVFNECMKACTGDYLWYAHPDMILVDPGHLGESMEGFAYYVNMRSFGGEDMEYEITRGRTDKWKLIMKNDFDLHYWGFYGDQNEDMYFRDISGDKHVVYRDMKDYPFHVTDLGVKVWHFCECKPRVRREEKMRNVLKTVCGITKPSELLELTENHQRVTLKSERNAFGDFRFDARRDPLPEVFQRYKEEFDSIAGGKHEGAGSRVRA